MTTLNLLIGIAKNVHQILSTQETVIMTETEMNDKLTALKTSMDALVAALAAARVTGVIPDAMGAQVDAMKAEADAAVTPPAPAA
jgi:hypothetical protein